MTIAYIRTYSNKQQTESQKNAIEQFAKAKKIEIDKWLKDAKNSSKEKNRLEDVIKNLQEGDILIVADVTRLSRKLMEIMHLILLCIHSGKYTELTFKKEKEKRYRINIKSGIFRYT